jgi:hypothetical protein
MTRRSKAVNRTERNTGGEEMDDADIEALEARNSIDKCQAAVAEKLKQSPPEVQRDVLEYLKSDEFWEHMKAVAEKWDSFSPSERVQAVRDSRNRADALVRELKQRPN